MATYCTLQYRWYRTSPGSYSSHIFLVDHIFRPRDRCCYTVKVSRFTENSSILPRIRFAAVWNSHKRGKFNVQLGVRAAENCRVLYLFPRPLMDSPQYCVFVICPQTFVAVCAVCRVGSVSLRETKDEVAAPSFSIERLN